MIVNDRLLIASLQSLLARLYVMYFRAHSAHWNVEGPSFPQLHAFFGDIYEDVFGSIDRFAEAIRQHGEMAPVDLGELLTLAPEQRGATKGGAPNALLGELEEMNDGLLAIFPHCREVAEKAGDFGLSNFIQDREAAHLKWQWQIRVQL